MSAGAERSHTQHHPQGPRQGRGMRRALGETGFSDSTYTSDTPTPQSKDLTGLTPDPERISLKRYL
jgi:hypothetical protein